MLEVVTGARILGPEVHLVLAAGKELQKRCVRAQRICSSIRLARVPTVRYGWVLRTQIIRQIGWISGESNPGDVLFAHYYLHFLDPELSAQYPGSSYHFHHTYLL